MRRYLSLEVLIRVIADIVLINVGYLSGHFFWMTSQNIRPPISTELISYTQALLEQGSVLTLIGISVFAISGFYTKGRRYQGRYKALLIFQSVGLTYLIFTLLLYLSKSSSALSSRYVIIFDWSVTWALISFARLYSTFWKRVIIKEEQLFQKTPTSNGMNRILVIGGAGYIGAVLCRQLLAKGYQIRVLDAMLYGEESIQDLLSEPHFECMRGDSRDIQAVARAIKDMDAVVHLGEIVGDPATALDEQLTKEINVAATRMVAEAAKGFGAKRVVYASSCSVYGASDQIINEQSSLNPLSLYARSKIDSEKTLLGLNDSDFHPVILRFATVYGMSPRPRFDLVINLLTAKAIEEGKITIHGGNQWRPFVHVSDIARAITLALEAPLNSVKGQIFNVGSNEQNYTISQLGDMVHNIVPESKLVIEAGNADHRNYQVSFLKIKKVLGFVPQTTVKGGILEIVEALKSGSIGHYLEKRYSNHKTLCDENDRLAIIRKKINELYAIPNLPAESIKFVIDPAR